MKKTKIICSILLAIILLPQQIRAENVTSYKDKLKIINDSVRINEKNIFLRKIQAYNFEEKENIKIGNPINKTALNIKDTQVKHEAVLTLNSNLYTINGKLRNNNGEPINLNGNIFIPIKIIAEMLNIKPEYNKKDETVFLTHCDFNVLLSIETGRIATLKDDNIKVLDSLIIRHKNQNYIPIKALEDIGITVEENKGKMIISYE